MAAAPNSSTIGGAGTGAGGPPLDPVLPDEALLVDELPELALDVLPEPDEPVLVDDPVLVLDPVLPLDPFDDHPPEDQPPDDHPLLLEP
ncbi:hypothetical protein ASE75_06965 [Sphingomonas sp. Leaf17]|uniref:hypothetical protein n=1 Tax=Sphingomonas sp. Leaf17 TaxID=1735683 RepID=UPI0006FA1601|nr:hypothetical protein [Sphingomonas sp. Leaf17]KQM64826.1 hypothetical protein ASE75_06965 [Sphingomonas sp. Leaf17]